MLSKIVHRRLYIFDVKKHEVQRQIAMMYKVIKFTCCTCGPSFRSLAYLGLRRCTTWGVQTFAIHQSYCIFDAQYDLRCTNLCNTPLCTHRGLVRKHNVALHRRKPQVHNGVEGLIQVKAPPITIKGPRTQLGCSSNELLPTQKICTYLCIFFV